MNITDNPFLTLRCLSKTFGNVEAVKGIDLSVDTGEFVALLGPSGCGKTSTLRMIAGFVKPTSGGIYVRGVDVTGQPPQRRNMGMVFQSYALFPHMSVTGNVEFGLKSRRMPSTDRAERIRWVLDLVGLSAQASRYPRELSGGQQQRVALARVLALRPDLLLFDEPLSNLDAKLRMQMRHEIRRLQREIGVTALFVTHDQDEAMTMADRIVVMDQGRIEQIGTPADIYDRPRTRFVANFIGTSNFFEGNIVGTVGALVLRCQSGLEQPIAAGARPADRRTLAIRPEKIEFVEAAVSGALPGMIMETVLLGSVIEYVVELRSGDRARVQVQRRSGVAERQAGEVVAITWRPEDAVLLE
jgi:ABC-type Fe3+/spermidine/putrescine transport system ATPase subunit